jgi:hypothetical protein
MYINICIYVYTYSMKILNISQNTLGKGLRLGLINQVIEFFSHVSYAVENNIKFINLDSINWVLSWKNKNTIKHSELFDIEFWNLMAPKHNFPLLVNYNNKYNIINVKALSWNPELTFFKEDNNYSIIFSKLLKPKKYILDIINITKPKSYGTIHFRLENDLKVIDNFWNKRLNIKKIYNEIKNTIHDVPDVVYACVSIQDVTDKYTLNVFNNNKSPWENVPLIFGGSIVCKKYNIPEKNHHLIGAIIDYYIAIDSTKFFIGHLALSTFSRSICVIRKRHKQQNFSISHTVDINDK